MDDKFQISKSTFQVLNHSNKIPLYDINQAAYQFYKGNKPDLELHGSRVIFLFNNDERFYSLSNDYNSNSLVAVCDFVTAQRQLRAMMMSLKGGGR